MVHSLKSALLAITVLIGGSPSSQANDSEGEDEKAAAEAASRLKMHYYFKGRHIFESQCVPCHGERGRGDGPWSEGLTAKPRNFRSGVFKFRTTPYGKLPTDDDLRRTIRAGISGTAMPTFQKLSDDDISGLIVYVQSFSRRWDDETLHAEPLKLPDIPEWFRDTGQLANHARKGGEKFAVTCIACHGPKGKGDGPASKELIDIWENPIVPADLTNEHHKSGDSPTDLYRTIATGLDGTPMLGFAETLSQAEIWNLVAFIKANEVDGQRVGERPQAGDN